MSANQKGQSAMEYLMTYGWALLVIVIVIAILFFIKPFRAPYQCLFEQPGFMCTGNVVLQSSNKVVFAQVTNGYQKSVSITGVACVKGSKRPSGDFSTWPGALVATKSVANQDYINTGSFKDDSGTTRALSCAAEGSVLTIAPGEDFQGKIYVRYKFPDDDAAVPDKIVGANLVTSAQ